MNLYWAWTAVGKLVSSIAHIEEYNNLNQQKYAVPWEGNFLAESGLSSPLCQVHKMMKIWCKKLDEKKERRSEISLWSTLVAAILLYSTVNNLLFNIQKL